VEEATREVQEVIAGCCLLLVLDLGGKWIDRLIDQILGKREYK